MTHDEIWDDSMLVAHYDDALEDVRRKVNERLNHKENGKSTCRTDVEYIGALQSEIQSQSSSGTSNKKTKSNRKRKNKTINWKVGMFCRCIYEGDNKAYEAEIISISNDCTTARVVFVGYNNEMECSVDKLYKSKGSFARHLQARDAEFNEGHSSETGRRSKTHSNPTMRMPHQFDHMDVPFPPTHMPLPVDPDGDALHSLLMSWYMAGYHTGYYRALKDNRHHC